MDPGSARPRGALPWVLFTWLGYRAADGRLPTVGPSSLWRDADFLKLWTGQTVSEFGSVVTRTALPLVALLTLEPVLRRWPSWWWPLERRPPRRPFRRGVGRPAAARPVLIWTDVVRAGLLFSVPAAAAVGTLGIAQLYAVAFLEACLGTLFHSAYRSYLPSLVGVDRLLEANAKLSQSSSVAEIADLASPGRWCRSRARPSRSSSTRSRFVVSAVSLLAIPRPGAAAPARAAPVDRPRDRRRIAGRPPACTRVPLAASSVSEHFFGSFYAALYGLYLLEVLGLTPLLLGIVISAGGVGALFGATLAGRVVRRIGIGRRSWS